MRLLVISSAIVAGVVVGVALRISVVHPLPSTHCSVTSTEPCPPVATHDASPMVQPTPAARPDAEAPEDSGQSLAQKSARLWVTGAPEPWTLERENDPKWGRKAVEQSLATWRELIPAPLDLQCDEYPCLLITNMRASKAFRGHHFDYIAKTILRALDATDQLHDGSWYGLCGWDYEILGIAPRDGQDPNIMTRVIWRANIELARHGDSCPGIVDKVRAIDPDIDLGDAP